MKYAIESPTKWTKPTIYEYLNMDEVRWFANAFRQERLNGIRMGLEASARVADEHYMQDKNKTTADNIRALKPEDIDHE